MDLVPPALIVARYFAEEQAKLDAIAAAVEEATRAVEEYTEEHAVEEGLLAEAMDDDKLSKALATARLRVAKSEKADQDEIKALEHLIGLYDAKAAGKRLVKTMQEQLDTATLKKYGYLTEADVKSLVLDDKWQRTLVARVAAETEALTLTLVARVQQLGERYAETVSDLDAELSALESKVAAHLSAMGVQ